MLKMTPRGGDLTPVALPSPSPLCTHYYVQIFYCPVIEHNLPLLYIQREAESICVQHAAVPHAVHRKEQTNPNNSAEFMLKPKFWVPLKGSRTAFSIIRFWINRNRIVITKFGCNRTLN